MPLTVDPKPLYDPPMRGNMVLFGIGLGVLAYGLFSVQDAAIKFLVETLPVWQVLLFRSVAVMAVCLIAGNVRLLARAGRSQVKGKLVLRAVLTMSAWLLYFTASREMGLAQLLTLYFAAPLMVTLLSGPLLQEIVTPRRWLAVGIGFVGVMFAADPFGVEVSLPALMVLIAALFWSYSTILMRQIARVETSLIQMLFNNALIIPLATIVSISVWQPPTPTEWAIMALVGALAGGAQFMVFEMARFTPASVMATVEYTALLWAFLLGWAIWGEIPHIAVWIGAVLIAISGVVLVMAERRRVTPSVRTQGAAC